MAKSENLVRPKGGAVPTWDVPAGRSDLLLALAAAALLAVVIQIGLALNGVAPVGDGVYVDPDAYMRLVRVRDLANGGAWFDPVLSRIGPPDGFVLHWTRPLDVLLLLGAWPASHFVGFEKALFWWGAAISPVFQILSLLALTWAAAPLLSRAALGPLAFFLIAQPGLFGRFMVGRPDHHGLLQFLMFLSLGFALRALLRPDDTRTARWLGLVSALSLWISVETLTLSGMIFAAIGLFWVTGERALAGTGRRMAVWLLFGAVAALFLERGPGTLLSLEADRLSLAHIVLLAANAAAWGVLEVWQRSGRRLASPSGRILAAAWGVLEVWQRSGRRLASPSGRILAAALVTSIGGAALWLLMPGFFSDPMAAGDALYRQTHLPALLAANAAAWGVLEVWQRSGRRLASPFGRILAAALVTSIGGAALWLLMPGFFSDPMAAGDALYRQTHLPYIEELQPLLTWPAEGAGIGAWAAALAKPVHWLGIAVLALPWLFWRLRNTAGGERRAWGLLAIGSVVFLPAGLIEARWAPYPEALLLIPYADCAAAALARVAARLPSVGLALVRPLLVVVFCVWFYLPLALVGTGDEAGASVATARACPLQDLAPVLDDPAGLGASPKRILALIDFGPELLYRTPHSVFAIPNHRPQPKYAEGYRIMSARDPEVARRGLAAIGADLILICPGSAEDWFYGQETGDGPTLYQRLRDGPVPAFLVPYDLPNPLAGHFKLFQVRG